MAQAVSRGPSLQRSRFEPGSDYVGFVVNKVALDRISQSSLGFSVNIIPKWFGTHIYHLGMERRPVGGRKSETQFHPTDVNNSNKVTGK
jgi:hypothetical protein